MLPCGAPFIPFSNKCTRVNLSEVVLDTNFIFIKRLYCFDTSKSSISEHITNILKDGELQEDSVVRIFRITASDNKQYNINFILEDEKNLEETYKVLKER